MTHQEKPEKDFIESKVGLVQRVMGWKDNDLILAHFRAALQEAVEFGKGESFVKTMTEVAAQESNSEHLFRAAEKIKEQAIQAYKKELVLALLQDKDQ